MWWGGETVRIVNQITKVTPIIAIDQEIDPVRSGLATSFARPGGNVTGLFMDQPSLAGKWIELLRAAVPAIERVALLWDPGTGHDQLQIAQAAVRAKGLESVVIEYSGATNFDDALGALGRRQRTGIVVLTSPIFNRNKFAPAARKQLPDLLTRIRFDNEKSTIRVFTIGYDSGGQKDVLQKIADATQAKFYEGKPENIREVFKDISTFF